MVAGKIAIRKVDISDTQGSQDLVLSLKATFTSASYQLRTM
jgi:hypothetical protein